MIHDESKLLARHLREAAFRYAQPDRPTLAYCHRMLTNGIAAENRFRQGRRLAPLRCPTPRRLRIEIDRIRRFDACAARHGIACARRRYGLKEDRS